MRVLVIGSGGREHAICWKIKQSASVDELYCIPGNPGIAQLAITENIAVDDIDAILEFAKDRKIDFTVVGPELPLSKGIVDRFRKEGRCIFGPSMASAQLESSKTFAKDVMQAAGVPTASSHTFETRESLEIFLRDAKAPLVLKADGLASGKGVFVCLCDDDIKRAVPELFSHGESSSRVLVEEYLSGVEVSYIVATDGERIVPLASSHDYKRLLDDDEGPNTGGMGSVSPTPRFNNSQEPAVIERVIRPVLQEMKRRGRSFSGFLYAGLMIDKNGEPKVLEFNARLGDPETQSLLRRADSSFAELLLALASGSALPEISWSAEVSTCIVLAAEGYPQKPVKGDAIEGIAEAEKDPAVIVFQAGTCQQPGGILVTNGGRVLSVTATGDSIEEARTRAYEAAKAIHFRGSHMRNDIALS